MAKRFSVKTMSIVAAASSIVAVSWASPASAGASVKWHKTEASADNNPGAGTAWVWVYAGSGDYGSTSGSVQYELTDGSVGSLSATIGKSATKDPGKKVRGIRACTDYYIDGYSMTNCSDWAYFS